MFTLRSSVLAIRRPSKGMIAESQERGLIMVGDNPYVTALSAVAAVGAALGDVGFAAKTDAARPPSPALACN